jgi:hypothetical protein
VDVEVLGSTREQFVEYDAFQHCGARPLARRVRLCRSQGVLDFLGILWVSVFVAVVVLAFAFGGVGTLLVFARTRVDVGEVGLFGLRQAP